MQHYAHFRETPRWGENDHLGPRKKQVRQYGDELQQHEYRLQRQTRGSWTAPLLFGRDTIKPIEEQSYAHLLLAQEQEYRNNKFNENQHHENKKVRGPSGATSPLKVWIPPLRVERLETDGLPKALAGVDIGTLLALAQTKEAFKHAGAARYAAATYRSACSASSKEARWATNLCGGRSDIAPSHTNPHPAYFTRPITTAGDKRRKFLAEYAQRTSETRGGRRKAPAPALDIRQVGWVTNRSGITYHSPSENTDPNYSGPHGHRQVHSARTAVRNLRRVRDSMREKKEWDQGLAVRENKGFIDPSLGGTEIVRESIRQKQLDRSRGLSSWTQGLHAKPRNGDDSMPPFVF